jgi:hypothetical protein
MLLLQFHAQEFEVCLKAFGRRPTPLCDTQQMVNRRGVIRSPMLRIMRALAVMKSIRPALPAQVLLQIRRCHCLQQHLPLSKITQEHAGNTHVGANRAAIQALVFGEIFPQTVQPASLLVRWNRVSPRKSLRDTHAFGFMSRKSGSTARQRGSRQHCCA